MNILGHGIDLVELESLKRALSLPGDHFIERCFTSAEQAQFGDSQDRLQHIAGKFAAKEAVAKAFGVGWGDDLAWTDIEILSEPSGRPRVALHASIAGLGAGVTLHLSISHGNAYAIASVIAVAK